MIPIWVGAFFICVFWPVIFRRWQNGVVLLLGYLPFAGAVTLAMYPSPLPTLFKDFFFVIPAYLAFLPSRENSATNVRIPDYIKFTMLGLAALIFFQAFNPEVANWLVAAIGMKVWLLYLPLPFLVFAMVTSSEELIRLLRLMVILAWIPCGLGIVQWIGCIAFGYEATMQAFYGDAAAGATQEFASFDLGGTFFRIPSTFTFVAQYFGYTLAMIVPAYALMKLDSSKKGRNFAAVTLVFIILASFLSGARSAFVFVPMLLVVTYLLEGKFLGVVQFLVVLPSILLSALYIADIDPMLLFDLMLELTLGYTDEIAKQGLLDAIANAPLGLGTGMNTGPARYAFEDQDSFVAFENYYAKATYELGVPGLVVVVALFLVLIGEGFKIRSRLQDPRLKACSSAILAFIITMVLNSFKGWQIDLDPINIYFWVFAGLLLKLGYLDKLDQSSEGIHREAPKSYTGHYPRTPPPR